MNSRRPRQWDADEQESCAERIVVAEVEAQSAPLEEEIVRVTDHS